MTLCKTCGLELKNKQRKFCCSKCYGSWMKENKQGTFFNRKIQSNLGKKGAEVTHTICKNNKTGFWSSDEQRKNSAKLSIEQRMINTNNWIKNGNRVKRIKYKDNSMRSSWEVKVAKWLDDNHIVWEYESNRCRFKLSNGKTYIIDFYLPSLNKYVEVKGWWDENSIFKYEEASKELNMCIIDSRNIENITLDVIEI